MAKVFKGLRFNPALYNNFRKIANTAGYTVTGTFEQFMEGCVEANELILPQMQTANFETEARVLVGWLEKGKRFYRQEDGTEVKCKAGFLN